MYVLVLYKYNSTEQTIKSRKGFKPLFDGDYTSVSALFFEVHVAHNYRHDDIHRSYYLVISTALYKRMID